VNRDQIIAKTLVDMGVNETTFGNLDAKNADSYPAYIREVVFPEMLKRLPEGDIITCDELRLEVECCRICHGFYPHYEMQVVELPEGRTGWICCAVGRALFPETAIADDDPRLLELMRMLGGDEAGSKEGPDSSEMR
jgi:hypothetical protein